MVSTSLRWWKEKPEFLKQLDVCPACRGPFESHQRHQSRVVVLLNRHRGKQGKLNFHERS